MKENPYRLTEVADMGFLTVDPIDRKVNGISARDYCRIAAGIRHVLKESESEGHLYLDSKEVIQRASNLFFKLDGKVSEDVIRQAGNRMVLKDQMLAADHGAIYLKENLEDEAEAVRHIVRLATAEPFRCADIDIWIPPRN